MAVKKLKSQPQQFLVPEGLYALPTPVLLWQKSSLTLWANPHFEKEFGVALVARFGNQTNLHLIRERPVSLQVFSMVGRHEGFVIENLVGKRVPVELKITPYGDPSEETFLVLVEEVSVKMELEKQLIQHHYDLQKAYEELKTTQDALVQAAKLASLGELSTGIAHELNQPLQAIMGFSQELQHQEKLSPIGSEFLADIISASQKMAEIIRSLRSFARQASDALSATHVDYAVDEAVKLMHHQLTQKGIDVDVKIDDSLPMIDANPIQLEQVLINIMSNARDAIEQAGKAGGKIRVEVRNQKSAVVVDITDNGCGMDEKTQSKVFDPFFTTKEVGKGTGLGMSISYGILKRFHADVKIKSKPGEGTTFTLVFPIQKSVKKGESS